MSHPSHNAATVTVVNRRARASLAGVRVMFDAVNVDRLPEGGDLYAGYVDGALTSGNFEAVRARFPLARLVRITTTGATIDAEVADVEAGDLTPVSAGVWAARKLARDPWASLYCSAGAWSEVAAAVRPFVGDANWHRVFWWVAGYDGHAVIPDGAVAKQYESTGYDTSVVADSWPGIDAEVDVVTIWSDGKRIGALSAQSGFRHLSGPEFGRLRHTPQLRAQVVNPDQPWEVSPEDFDSMLAGARATS